MYVGKGMVPRGGRDCQRSAQMSYQRKRKKRKEKKKKKKKKGIKRKKKRSTY